MVGAQILILGSIIYINVLSQHSNQMATNKAGAENLALAIEGGMIDALAIGDNDVSSNSSTVSVKGWRVWRS